MRLHKIISSFRSSIIVVVLLFSCTMHCEARPPFACDPSDPRTGRFPFCNMKTSTSNRVRDLIKRLNLTEKIRLIVNNAIPIQRLGIKGYEWWSEALHGVSNTGPGVHFGGEFPGATAFPQVITTAASLNASLWKAIGEVVSDEARAMYKWGQAGLTFWSPNVNVFRDPRWGRGQETPGEDPFIVSKYAVNYVKGLQGEDRNNRLKVAACCKHYTAYDLDSWNGNNRFLFNAVVSKQDLEETYNVPFKDCVTKANVASVMCSYNQVNGKPTCADPVLLRDTIRGHWNLNGYIVSDCDSVDVFYNKQHYTSTAEEAAAIAIKAGLDLDCGPFLALHTEKAIQSHKLNVSDVDQALTNLITVQMRLGMYDDPTTQLYNQLGPNNVCTPAHQQLALEAAQQGIVLLKNPNRALPLPNTKFSTIAVIGPNANASLTMIGNYAGIPCHYTTPLQGISKYGKMTTYEIGCTTIQCDRYTRYKEAERAARRASATVLVMGLDQSIECEGLDRVDLLLPGNQEKLVTRVARASAGPVVLVIMSGGPIDVTFAKNDRNIDAILWVGYPGQAGGAAIADVIFGKFNPGGKLPMTWYPQEYLAKVPMTDMRMHADQATNYPGRTHRFYTGNAVYNFGDGLHYGYYRHTLAKGPRKLLVPIITNSKAFKNTTSGGIRVSHTSCEAFRLRVHVDVENVGGMDGAHTVMAFVTTPSKEKRLVGFEKIHLAVGAKERVQFKIDTCDHMSVVDKYGIRRIERGEYKIKFNEDLTHTVTLYTLL